MNVAFRLALRMHARIVPWLVLCAYAMVVTAIPALAHAQDPSGAITSFNTAFLNVLRVLGGTVMISCVFYWLFLAFAFFTQGIIPSLYQAVSSTIRQGVIISILLFIGGAAMFGAAENFVGGFTGAAT